MYMSGMEFPVFAVDRLDATASLPSECSLSAFDVGWQNVTNKSLLRVLE